MKEFKDFPNKYTAYINDQDIRDFGALVESLKVGASPVTNHIYQGRNRTNFTELSYEIGMLPLTVSIFFSAGSRRELSVNKSRLDAALIGKPELLLPDGFYYTASLQSAGELAMLGQEDNQMIALCAYTFTAIRHDALRTVTGNTFRAEGTAPRMDAKLVCTASQAYSMIQVGTVIFHNVAQGDVLTADGINGRLLINGTPAAQRTTFMRLPFVVPGLQTISCPETLTVSYAPTWV